MFPLSELTTPDKWKTNLEKNKGHIYAMAAYEYRDITTMNTTSVQPFGSAFCVTV